MRFPVFTVLFMLMGLLSGAIMNHAAFTYDDVSKTVPCYDDKGSIINDLDCESQPQDKNLLIFMSIIGAFAVMLFFYLIGSMLDDSMRYHYG